MDDLSYDFVCTITREAYLSLREEADEVIVVRHEPKQGGWEQ